MIRRQKNLLIQTGKMQTQAKKLEDKTKVLQKAADKESEKEAARLLDNKKRNVQKLQNDIASITKQVENYNTRWNLVKDKNKTLEADWQEIQKQLQDAVEEKENIQEGRDAKVPQPAQSEQEKQQEITNLKLRRDVLASSLKAVEVQYRNQELAIGEFTQEQLDEYITILKNENQGLQEKVRTLMESLETLPE